MSQTIKEILDNKSLSDQEKMELIDQVTTPSAKTVENQVWYASEKLGAQAIKACTVQGEQVVLTYWSDDKSEMPKKMQVWLTKDSFLALDESPAYEIDYTEKMPLVTVNKSISGSFSFPAIERPVPNGYDPVTKLRKVRRTNLDGTVSTWYIDLEGKKEGQEIDYYPSGRPRTMHEYSHGLLSGHVVEWFDQDTESHDKRKEHCVLHWDTHMKCSDTIKYCKDGSVRGLKNYQNFHHTTPLFLYTRPKPASIKIEK